MALQAPKAKKIKKYFVDIVFCIDVTASMNPCIEGIKKNIRSFVHELERGNLDFQLALIGYRDIHDTAMNNDLRIPVCEEPWFNSGTFTSKVETFETWLTSYEFNAFGGGDEPESTLDALYLALNMPGWRESSTHRVIILFTDSDTHPTLSPKTYPRKDNTVGRVIQELSTRMKHGILYICAPRSDTYDKIQRQGNGAGRKVIMDPVEPGQGMKDVDFKELLEMIGKTVSSSAPSVYRGRED